MSYTSSDKGYMYESFLLSTTYVVNERKRSVGKNGLPEYLFHRYYRPYFQYVPGSLYLLVSDSD